jgi:rubrerythrin
MPSLKGTETEHNLKDALAGESQTCHRYLYFARRADVEGFNDVAAVFRSTAEGETWHAHEYLGELGDPGDRQTDRPDRRQPRGCDRQRQEACLSRYDVDRVVSSSSYVAVDRDRQSDVQAHHVDHLQNAGAAALGARNILLIAQISSRLPRRASIARCNRCSPATSEAQYQ